jgi:hypothetical protein
MPDTRMTLLSAAALMATELVLPVMRGVVGIYMPTDAAAATIKNWKNGGGDGAVVGSPTYGTGFYTSSNQNNRIDTLFEETAASTQYVVARSGASFSGSGNVPVLCGVFRSQSGGFAGTSIRVEGTPSAAPAATITLAAARDIAGVPQFTGASAAIAVANFSNWTMLCGRVKDGAVSAARRLNDLTNGTSASVDVASARILADSSNNNIMMGNTSSLNYGTVDVSYYVLGTLDHTDAEMTANAAFIRDAIDYLYGFTV